MRTIRERVEAEARRADRADRRLGRLGARARQALAESGLARVIHYDRNLGKGYAVKTGALAARGRYISYVDADLDLDPASIPDFLELAQEESARLRDRVEAPPGLAGALPAVATRRELAVPAARPRCSSGSTSATRRSASRCSGGRSPRRCCRSCSSSSSRSTSSSSPSRARSATDGSASSPCSCEYRFTGSGVRSVAVLLALIDTAAIFYRLRILRYYHRKRELLPAYARTQDFRPRVTLVAPGRRAGLDYAGRRARRQGRRDARGARGSCSSRAEGEVVALPRARMPLRPRTGSTRRCPFLANPRIAAVVTPSLAPAQGSLRELRGRGSAGVLARRRLALLSLHAREPALRHASSPARTSSRGARTASSCPRRTCTRIASAPRSPTAAGSCSTRRRRSSSHRGRRSFGRTSRVSPRSDVRAGAVRSTRAPRLQRRRAAAARAAGLPRSVGWPLALLGGAWQVAWALVWRVYLGLVLAERASRRSSLPFAPRRDPGGGRIGGRPLHVRALACFGACFAR